MHEPLIDKEKDEPAVLNMNDQQEELDSVSFKKFKTLIKFNKKFIFSTKISNMIQ